MLKYRLFLIALILSVPAWAWNAPTISSPAQGSSQFVGVYLNWNPILNSAGYQRQIDTSAAFNSPLFNTITEAYINSSSGNSDTDDNPSNLRFGQKYFWRVRAFIAGDTSAWTTSDFTTLDLVTQSSPNNGDNWTGVTINWAPHNGVLFYDLQIDTSSNFNSSVLLNVSKNYINSTNGNSDTEHFASNLFFGKTYYWRVRARNAVDTSNWSTNWTFTTRDFVTQSSPNAIDTWTGTTINWTPHSGVLFYDMQADTAATFNSTALRNVTNNYINSTDGNSDTQSFLTDLYFGKTYYWRVRARNAVDTSNWSANWTFTTRDFVTQSSPNAIDTWTGTTINWTPHSGVLFYDMQADTAATFNSTALRNVTTNYINSTDGNSDTQAFLSNLYFGKTYFWRVRARNAADTSSWSPVWSFVTRDYVNLTGPSDGFLNLSVNPTLNWAPHNGILFYQLQLDSSNLFNTPAFFTINKNFINSTDGNSDTNQGFSGLNANTIYFWRVRAINNNDTSSWTSRWFSTGNAPLVLPAAPVTADPSCGGINVPFSDVSFVWSAIANADSYQLEVKNGFLNGEPNYTNLINNTFIVSSLQQGTSYCWRVRTVDNGNAGPWSDECCFSTASSVSISVPLTDENSYCESSSLSINYSTVGAFDPSNQFTVQLSNAFGSFSSPTNIGTFTNGGSGNYTTALPSSLFGNSFKVRIVSSNPSAIGAESSIFTILALPELIGSLEAFTCAQNVQLELAEILPAGGVYNGPTVQGSTFFPNTAGSGIYTITYTYTDVNTCSASVSGDIFVDECTGINNQVNHPIITIVANNIHIKFAQKQTQQLRLFNAEGKCLREISSNAEEIDLSIVDFPSGIYFLVWHNQATSGSHKLLKLQ